MYIYIYIYILLYLPINIKIEHHRTSRLRTTLENTCESSAPSSSSRCGVLIKCVPIVNGVREDVREGVRKGENVPEKLASLIGTAGLYIQNYWTPTLKSRQMDISINKSINQ